MDFFLCSLFLIMFSVTATSTTPPVTDVCSTASPITMVVTMAPISVGFAASGQHDVVLPQHLILRDTMRVSVGPATIPQAATMSAPDSFLCICQFCKAPPQVNFFFQNFRPLNGSLL